MFSNSWDSSIASSVSQAWPLPTFSPGELWGASRSDDMCFRLGWRGGSLEVQEGEHIRPHCRTGPGVITPLFRGAFCDRIILLTPVPVALRDPCDGLFTSLSLREGRDTPLLAAFSPLQPAALPPLPSPSPAPLSPTILPHRNRWYHDHHQRHRNCWSHCQSRTATSREPPPSLLLDPCHRCLGFVRQRSGQRWARGLRGAVL